jgi:hypothetical protein
MPIDVRLAQRLSIVPEAELESPKSSVAASPPRVTISKPYNQKQRHKARPLSEVTEIYADEDEVEELRAEMEDIAQSESESGEEEEEEEEDLEFQDDQHFHHEDDSEFEEDSEDSASGSYEVNFCCAAYILGRLFFSHAE